MALAVHFEGIDEMLTVTRLAPQGLNLYHDGRESAAYPDHGWH